MYIIFYVSTESMPIHSKLSLNAETEKAKLMNWFHNKLTSFA